jgi:hypothetical protein
MLVELVMRHRDADLMQGDCPAQKVDIVLVLRRIELDHLSKKRQGGLLDATDLCRVDLIAAPELRTVSSRVS